KKEDDLFKDKVEAFIRVLNIGKKYREEQIDEDLFQSESEKRLFEKYINIKDKITASHLAETEILQALEELAEPIHAFFENNMVMDDNESIKNNRIALLYRISELLRSF